MSKPRVPHYSNRSDPIAQFFGDLKTLSTLLVRECNELKKILSRPPSKEISSGEVIQKLNIQVTELEELGSDTNVFVNQFNLNHSLNSIEFCQKIYDTTEILKQNLLKTLHFSNSEFKSQYRSSYDPLISTDLKTEKMTSRETKFLFDEHENLEPQMSLKSPQTKLISHSKQEKISPELQSPVKPQLISKWKTSEREKDDTNLLNSPKTPEFNPHGISSSSLLLINSKPLNIKLDVKTKSVEPSSPMYILHHTFLLVLVEI